VGKERADRHRSTWSAERPHETVRSGEYDERCPRIVEMCIAMRPNRSGERRAACGVVRHHPGGTFRALSVARSPPRWWHVSCA